MLNNLVLMGRLTKEPLEKELGETTIVNFDIAVDNIRKEADGTRGTSFFSIVCFNMIAKNVVSHLHKGSKVAVVGSIQQRNFLRKDGTKGSTYEVIADGVEFLDPKPASEKDEKLTPEDEVKDDELPFDKEEAKTSKTPEAEAKFDPYTGKPLKPASKK